MFGFSATALVLWYHFSQCWVFPLSLNH
jgi:hypothetical protein